MPIINVISHNLIYAKAFRGSFHDVIPADLSLKFFTLFSPSFFLASQSTNQSGCSQHLPATSLCIIKQILFGEINKIG